MYSENPEYESVPVSSQVTRKAVKDHEKRVKQDIKDAHLAEIQIARIQKILPQIYDQLSIAVDAPRRARDLTGPAALRRRQEDEGVEISFKSRGIDQKALRRYLPVLLAEYQRQVDSGEIIHQSQTTGPVTSPDASAESPEFQELSRSLTDATLVEQSTSRPTLQHAATTSRIYNPDKMKVTAGYFEDYTQKIYFSKKFINLWKKKDGKRENLASGVAMVLIGIKIGLPIFDLFTFAAIDVPRLALQRITGKQTLKMAD